MALQARLQALVRSGFHSGAVIGWSRGGAAAQFAAAGDLDPDRPFFAASCTKLVVTALTVMLAGEGRLRLDQPFRSILDGPQTARLHLTGGNDRTGEISLRQLLQHCSGLPDYLQSNGRGGLLADLTAGHDRGWSFAEAMEIARRLGPVGLPGDLRRAHYADTNFQILGQVIERLEGRSLAETVHARILAPLDLRQSWIYTDPADRRPAVLRHGRAALDIPRAMASFQADGGLVTTARDGLALVGGLFGGALMPSDWWRGLDDWRPAFFPLDYGTGLMRFRMHRLLTGFRQMPALIGHSGLSGSVLFFAPETGLAMAGSVNQVGRRSTVYRLAVELALGRD